MPFSRKFREGMGFPEEGQIVDGFTVESVSVSHVGVSEGRYEYPFEIVVKGEGNANKVKTAFKGFFKARRTVFSEYGNPYQCHHGKVEVKDLGSGKFSIVSRGACTRVFLKDELERFTASLKEKGTSRWQHGRNRTENHNRRIPEKVRKGDFSEKPVLSITLLSAR